MGYINQNLIYFEFCSNLKVLYKSPSQKKPIDIYIFKHKTKKKNMKTTRNNPPSLDSFSL